MATETARATRTRGHRRLIAILWVLVAVLAAGLVYTVWLNRSLRSPETQTKIAERASQEIIDAVSTIILVPTDKPTVATITDVDKLRQSNQEFYKNSRNGDILLVYQSQAIIYRKEEHRVIAVVPVVVSPSSTSGTSGTSTEESEDEENIVNETSSGADVESATEEFQR
ncbi:MAG: hypothetical protein Q8P33_00885 [bacterium]|nr:hypothetical protein [bacterium]